MLTIVQNLVYGGFGHVGGASTHDIRLTTYKGQPHPSFYTDRILLVVIEVMVLLWIAPTTQSLRFSLETEEPPNDIHEFTVLPGDTAITTVFEPVQYNLSAYGVSQPVGWVLE